MQVLTGDETGDGHHVVEFEVGGAVWALVHRPVGGVAVGVGENVAHVEREGGRVAEHRPEQQNDHAAVLVALVPEVGGRLHPVAAATRVGQAADHEQLAAEWHVEKVALVIGVRTDARVVRGVLVAVAGVGVSLGAFGHHSVQALVVLPAALESEGVVGRTRLLRDEDRVAAISEGARCPVEEAVADVVLLREVDLAVVAPGNLGLQRRDGGKGPTGAALPLILDAGGQGLQRPAEVLVQAQRGGGLAGPDLGAVQLILAALLHRGRVQQVGQVGNTARVLADNAAYLLVERQQVGGVQLPGFVGGGQAELLHAVAELLKGPIEVRVQLDVKVGLVGLGGIGAGVRRQAGPAKSVPHQHHVLWSPRRVHLGQAVAVQVQGTCGVRLEQRCELAVSSDVGRRVLGILGVLPVLQRLFVGEALCRDHLGPAAHQVLELLRRQLLGTDRNGRAKVRLGAEKSVRRGPPRRAGRATGHQAERQQRQQHVTFEHGSLLDAGRGSFLRCGALWYAAAGSSSGRRRQAVSGTAPRMAAVVREHPAHASCSGHRPARAPGQPSAITFLANLRRPCAAVR